MCSDASLPDADEFLAEDEIVAEVRATRERLTAAAGNDLDRLWNRWETLEAEQRALGRVVLMPHPAKPEKPGAAA